MKLKKVKICSFSQFGFSHLSRGMGIGLEGRDKGYTVDLIELLLHVNLSLYTLHTKSKKYIEH